MKIKHPNGRVVNNLSRIDLNLTECKSSYFTGIEENFNLTNFNNSYCLYPDLDLNISGDFEDEFFDIL